MVWIFLLFPFFLFCGEWAEKTLSAMTLEEKVGQLFVAPLCPLRGEGHREDWLRLLGECHIGSVLTKQSDPESQVRWLNALQVQSKIPLLVTADFEWGLGMRMTGAMTFPRNGELSALSCICLLYEMGREVGRQALRVGVHLNLAPVVDVNNNPQNPIIGIRSFGADPMQVAQRASAYIHGFQSTQALACAKHFPGHGDTTIDSHKALPLIPHSRERLDQVELFPFRQAVQDGVAAIMVGHLLVPSIDPLWPASLSSRCLKELLRKEFGFEGLIISDALNMGALANSYSPEEVALRAFNAGCDLLLYGSHLPEVVDDLLRNQIPRAYRALLAAFREERLSLKELEAAVLRILRAKEKVDLPHSREVSLDHLLDDLQTPAAIALKKKIEAELLDLAAQR